MTDWIAALLALAQQEDEGDGEIPALSLEVLTSAPAAAGAEMERAAEELRSGTGPWALPIGEPMAGADRTAPAMPGAVQAELTGLSAAAPERRAEGLSALGRVYRQAVEALAPPAAAAPIRWAETEGETDSAPMTAESFDRLFCRDSRRYDGGMSIY